MYKTYEIEKEGQIDFFKNYGIPFQEGDVLIENTDGVFNGCILEFKLTINNLNKVLFQAIKYLSRLRIKGESVPKTILLIDLNNRKAYEYDSVDYIDDIQRVYVGAASKDNDNFVAGDPKLVYDYKNTLDSSKLKKTLKKEKKYPEGMYMPIDIDESCIVGWAERYYRENPSGSKGDFIGDLEGQIKIVGEIRKPTQFKGLINPYKYETNAKFKYLMDCLNDRLQKKDLGAFYTPMPYARKAAELVQMAANRAIDAGKKDYVVIDASAGTGNLEAALVGLYDKNGDEIISHSVVSTYEYYEYKVLAERLGDKVRDIIPPTEDEVDYANGKVNNADAMSEEFINNPIIKQYLDDENCAIIMFENPPYRDSSSFDKKESNKNESYIYDEMKKELDDFSNNNISTARDISNRFIWRAFKYYLRQDTDAYIVFAPVKYFKSLGIINKKFIKGFAFNRNHFHATASVISCILWVNEDDESTQEYALEAYDVINDSCAYVKDLKIKKAQNTFESFFDRRVFKNDKETSLYLKGDGYERDKGAKKEGKSFYNDNIIGYLRTLGFVLAPLNCALTTTTHYNIRGFYLRSDNYLEKLPLFVAKLFPQDNWYDKDVYFTTSDGGDAYTHDNDFIKFCLIYTNLSNQNKCLSFTGSDGRYYKNELCFDEGTLSSKDLEKFQLDKEEEELISLWNKILNQAKSTKLYKKDLSYGIYQITKELNTFKLVKTGASNKKVYDYPELNGNLETLRVKLKEYYKSHITNKMFQYKLIK